MSRNNLFPLDFDFILKRKNLKKRFISADLDKCEIDMVNNISVREKVNMLRYGWPRNSDKSLIWHSKQSIARIARLPVAVVD